MLATSLLALELTTHLDYRTHATHDTYSRCRSSVTPLASARVDTRNATCVSPWPSYAVPASPFHNCTALHVSPVLAVYASRGTTARLPAPTRGRRTYHMHRVPRMYRVAPARLLPARLLPDNQALQNAYI